MFADLFPIYILSFLFASTSFSKWWRSQSKHQYIFKNKFITTSASTNLVRFCIRSRNSLWNCLLMRFSLLH